MQLAWPALVQAAANAGVDLLAEGFFSPTSTPSGGPFNYYVYAACCATVELDVLTGETEVSQLLLVGMP